MNDIRPQSVKALTSTLSALQTNNGISTAAALSQEIEEAVYAIHEGDTGNAYRGQLRDIVLDLGKNNVALAQRLLSGGVDVQELVRMGPEGMKSAERAREDDEMREQGLRESLGSSKIPVTESGGTSQGPAAATDLGMEGEVGMQEASLGEEGDLKLRSQPKIVGLQGIEFESGL